MGTGVKQHLLNEGQKAAAEGFFNFLMSTDNELIISGPGGVGKTFLMGYLIDTVIPRYQEICSIMGLPAKYHSVVMTATTNKAAEVLGKATGRPTQTIHSFLGLRVQEDFKTGVSKLARGRNWKVHSNQIIFIDEASMIDRALLQMIREGTLNCKIVYVGDHCQLAPVTETISPIYKAQLPFYELTEPMRNAGQPALLEVCNQLRETVETKKFRPIKIVPGIIDHLNGREMEQEVASHFQDPNHEHRILAYTNAQVVAYNDHIRKLRQLPALYTKGEIVVNNTAILHNGNMMSVEDEFEIAEVSSNSEFIDIDNDNGVKLEVVYLTLVGRHFTFTKVPVPVDKHHFTQLIKYYAKQKDWPKYYHLKNTYPDLRPRDAATIHKAQGSTYDTVFIDLDDLSTCRNPAMASRLLYVAFSRARRRVVLYGDLAHKYGGLTR